MFQEGNTTVEFVMLDTIELCGNSVGEMKMNLVSRLHYTSNRCSKWKDMGCNQRYYKEEVEWRENGTKRCSQSWWTMDMVGEDSQSEQVRDMEIKLKSKNYF